MSVQVAIEVSEDRGNTLKAAPSAGSVRQEEHPLIGGRARGPQSDPNAAALVDVIRMALDSGTLKIPRSIVTHSFLGPQISAKVLCKAGHCRNVPKRLRVVHGDDAPHERLVPVPGLGSVQVRRRRRSR